MQTTNAIIIFVTFVILRAAAQDLDHRLPKNVVPYHYNIIIDIDQDFHHFSGSTQIYCKVLEQTTRIILHAVRLLNLDVHIFFNGAELPIGNKTYHNNFQFVIMDFVRPLIPGDYIINAKYMANFNPGADGLYLTNYMTTSNQIRSAAVTVFQAMHAREVFPCFDEPALTAQFNISLVRNNGDKSLSNKPLQDTQMIENGRFQDIFEMTPKMSTFLVAFAVCDFANKSYTRGHFFIQPSEIKGIDYAISITEAAIATMEHFIEMALPLKKLDIIAIPHISRTGLESLGLILLSEKHILYDKNKTQKHKEGIFHTVVNKIVHQWFSNLVSPAWWNYLWLNKGISMLLHYKLGDQLMPKWRLRDQMALHGLRAAVEVDNQLNARSISQKVEEPSNYKEYFDNITYYKASMVLFTLENIVGKEIIKQGLKLYLTNNKYSTVTGHDLWDSFQKSLGRKSSVFPKGLNLTTVMESWEHQPGIPVLNVTVRHGSIKFSQFRFLLNKMEKSTAEWCIPINIATQSHPDFQNLQPVLWLRNSRPLKGIVRKRLEDWVIINKEASFYYLVNYDEINWKRIASALNSDNYGNIPPLTRAKLLFDAFTLAESKDLKYSIALELTKYLRKEKDYYVWNTFFYVFLDFYNMFSGLDNFHYLQEFLADALEPVLKELGIVHNKRLSVEVEHLSVLNRAQIIEWACLLGNSLCRNLARQQLRNFDSVSPDLKQEIFCGGFRGTTIEQLNEYSISVENQDFIVKHGLLGCSENTIFLYVYLTNGLYRNTSRFHDIFTKGNFGVNYGLEYLQKNWRLFDESLSLDDQAAVIKQLSGYLTTDSQLNKLKYIATALASNDLYLHFKTAIRKVEERIQVVKSYSDDITYWIKHEISSAESLNVSILLCVFFNVLLIKLYV